MLTFDFQESASLELDKSPTFSFEWYCKAKYTTDMCCSLLFLQEYKPVPKNRVSSEATKSKRKSSKTVSESSSSSDEDQMEEKVRKNCAELNQVDTLLCVYCVQYVHVFGVGLEKEVWFKLIISPSQNASY